MSDTWEINDHGEVVPYTSGRMNHDTSHWRDATPLELEQKSRIQELESELVEASANVATLVEFAQWTVGPRFDSRRLSVLARTALSAVKKEYTL